MAKDTTETRFIPAATFEVRAEGEGEEQRRKIVGHVAVFNEWSPVYGDFRERIDPGFFDVMLEDDAMDVRALYNHDRNYVLGRRGNGTLKLGKDKAGLVMDNDPPDTGYARDVVHLLERGDIAGGSFSFRLPEDGTGDKWETGEDGIMERTLLRAAWIGDVGPVAEPFYPNTAIAARSLDHWRAEHEAREAANDAEPEVDEAPEAKPDEAAAEGPVEEPAAEVTPDGAEAEPAETADPAEGEGEPGEGEAVDEGADPDPKPQGAEPAEVRDEEPDGGGGSDSEPQPETISLEMAQRFQEQAAKAGTV